MRMNWKRSDEIIKEKEIDFMRVLQRKARGLHQPSNEIFMVVGAGFDFLEDINRKANLSEQEINFFL